MKSLKISWRVFIKIISAVCTLIYENSFVGIWKIKWAALFKVPLIWFFFLSYLNRSAAASHCNPFSIHAGSITVYSLDTTLQCADFYGFESNIRIQTSFDGYRYHGFSLKVPAWYPPLLFIIVKYLVNKNNWDTLLTKLCTALSVFEKAFRSPCSNLDFVWMGGVATANEAGKWSLSSKRTGAVVFNQAHRSFRWRVWCTRSQSSHDPFQQRLVDFVAFCFRQRHRCHATSTVKRLYALFPAAAIR